MFIDQMVTECDFTGKEYDTPVKGAGAVCRGATGRWCVVMWAGPEYLAEHPNIEVTDYNEAVAKINSIAGPDYADF